MLPLAPLKMASLSRPTTTPPPPQLPAAPPSSPQPHPPSSPPSRILPRLSCPAPLPPPSRPRTPQAMLPFTPLPLVLEWHPLAPAQAETPCLSPALPATSRSLARALLPGSWALLQCCCRCVHKCYFFGSWASGMCGVSVKVSETGIIAMYV